MTSPPTVVIMLYKIYIMLLPTDKWNWCLQAYWSCSFELYFCVYLLLCASLRYSASENELSLFSFRQHVYSHCVSVFILCVLSSYQFFLTCLVFNAAFSSCAWVLNFLHCERPKTLACTCMYLASFPGCAQLFN